MESNLVISFFAFSHFFGLQKLTLKKGKANAVGQTKTFLCKLGKFCKLSENTSHDQQTRLSTKCLSVKKSWYMPISFHYPSMAQKWTKFSSPTKNQTCLRTLSIPHGSRFHRPFPTFWDVFPQVFFCSLLTTMLKVMPLIMLQLSTNW